MEKFNLFLFLLFFFRVKLPDVHKHLESKEFHWALIATKWFVCCYAEVLPTEVTYSPCFSCLHFLYVQLRVAVCTHVFKGALLLKQKINL